MTNMGRWLVALGAAAASASAGAQVAENQAPASGLEEVVVTAQKQSEDLQRTAAAVTVLDSTELIASGVNDLRAAQMLTPSVRFQAENNNTQVFIRGVGANLDFANVESSVGFVLNGAYLPREGTSAAFFDLARLEVLPGAAGYVVRPQLDRRHRRADGESACAELRRQRAARARRLFGRPCRLRPEHSARRTRWPCAARSTIAITRATTNPVAIPRTITV